MGRHVIGVPHGGLGNGYCSVHSSGLCRPLKVNWPKNDWVTEVVVWLSEGAGPPVALPDQPCVTKRLLTHRGILQPPPHATWTVCVGSPHQ